MRYRITNTPANRAKLHTAAVATGQAQDLQTRYNPDNSTFTVCEPCVRGHTAGDLPRGRVTDVAGSRALETITLADVQAESDERYPRPCILCGNDERDGDVG